MLPEPSRDLGHSPSAIRHQLMRGLPVALASLVGMVAFLWPFWSPVAQDQAGVNVHAQDAPLVTALIVGLCVLVAVADRTQMLNAKSVALLGVLCAVNATLRLAENFFPNPGGFSLVFVLIILVGYVFGARMGFLMGALSLLTSALVTGGVGPWLPFQMIASGWVGMTAGWLGKIQNSGVKSQTVVLTVFGLVWGMVFGAVMNLYFWPFISGGTDQYYQTGLGVTETLKRYAAFYVVTSLWYDAGRAVGNAVLIAAVGPALVRTLRRFKRRLSADMVPTFE
jgi:energy-coupling factor transport system substrate-specific component